MFVRSSQISAALGIAAILLTPLLGAPPSVLGIPIWYQNSFLWGLLATVCVGIFAVIAYSLGYFQRVRWVGIDLVISIMILYSVLQLLFQEMVSPSSWMRVAFFSSLYFLGRLLFSQLSGMSIDLLLTVILMAGISEVGYGLGQLYGFWSSHHNLFAFTGSFFNPGLYCGWLACVMPIAIWTLFEKKNKFSSFRKISRILAIIYLFLMASVLISATSRSAWLAASVGCFILFWQSIRRYFILLKNYVNLKWFLPFVGLIIVAGLLWMYNFKKGSADGRVLIWKISTDVVMDYPLFGAGLGRFKVVYNEHQSFYFSLGNGSLEEMYLADYVHYPYNELLGWTVETGIVGLILVLLIGQLSFQKWRQFQQLDKLEPVHFLALAVVSVWVTFSMFSYPMGIIALAVFGIFSFAALVTTYSMCSVKENDGSGRVNKYAGIGAALVITFFAGYGLIWHWKCRSILRDWIGANANYQLGKFRYPFANEIYIRLWPFLKNEGAYLRIAGKSFSQTRNFFSSELYLERALYFSLDPVILTTLGHDYTSYGKLEPEKYERAEMLLLQAKHMRPGRYYPRYLLMELYEKIGAIDKLREEAKAILAMRTKVESYAVQEIRLKAKSILSESTFEVKITPKEEE